MAEVLVEYSDRVTSKDGRTFIARACGAEMDDTRWQGWIEFIPVDGGSPVRSGRETTQPNRQDALYWATGLTTVYLEGALARARKPVGPAPKSPIDPPAYDEPARESPAPPRPDSVLNPFSVYRKGEGLLRSRLGALSAWHLVNIVRDYELSDVSQAALSAMTEDDLIDLIVTAVRLRTAPARTR